MRLAVSVRRDPGLRQFAMAMLELLARAAGAKRIARQAGQVGTAISLGMADMAVLADMTDIAALVQDHGEIAQPVIEGGLASTSNGSAAVARLAITYMVRGRFS